MQVFVICFSVETWSQSVSLAPGARHHELAAVIVAAAVPRLKGEIPHHKITSFHLFTAL